jgi:hypothetical protein
MHELPGQLAILLNNVGGMGCGGACNAPECCAARKAGEGEGFVTFANSDQLHQNMATIDGQQGSVSDLHCSAA